MVGAARHCYCSDVMQDEHRAHLTVVVSGGSPAHAHTRTHLHKHTHAPTYAEAYTHKQHTHLYSLHFWNDFTASTTREFNLDESTTGIYSCVKTNSLPLHGED